MDNIKWAKGKLSRCVRLARDCSQDYRETRDRRYRQIRVEAMQDARYWRAKCALYAQET